MCRSTTGSGDFPPDRLKVRAFHLRFTLSGAAGGKWRRPPETLTLVYLPRINGDVLELNGAKIRADAPAIVALHRVRSSEPAGGGEAAYASTDRVRAGEGARFEAYVGAEKVLKGVFRRGREGRWGMECHVAAEDPEAVGVAAAEVCVVGERGVLVRERVEMTAARRWRRRRGFCLKLEEIPEEMDGCDCCCCGGDEEEEHDDQEEKEWESVGLDGEEMEGGDGLEMERVRWAVDLGIWAMCVGVGLLVSRASYRGLRRRKLV